MTGAPLKSWHSRDGRMLRLRLARPKANLIDAEMIAALEEVLAAHLDEPKLAAVLIDADGPNFSFGASVEEHMPEHCARMLAALHRLIVRLAESPVPILVAVRGPCLGGGLEVAAAGHLLFAADDAVFGQPEITLGVFAPAASCLLPARIGQARAEDLLLTGRTIDAAEALRIGLATEVADDPEAAALAYFDRYLAPRSASSLRLAVRAARPDFTADLARRIAVVERLYLDELMQTRDAVEGLTAFVERRPPRWENR